MELSWFFAWAMFATIATMHSPFPFFETIITFVLAGFITHVSMGRGWRIVQILGLQILAFVCAALMVTHRLYYGTHALFSRGWLFTLFTGSKDAQSWLILLMNLFLVSILWAAGVTFVRRPKAYYATCSRFDFGLSAFFALLIVRLIALVKGGMTIDDSLSLLFVFPFFLFSLLSIGMVRIESTASKAFLPGYQGMGVIVSFIAIVLLGAGGLVLFFLPGLTLAAQMSYRVLKVAGGPLGYLFVSVVRFMFMPRSSRPNPSAESLNGIDWHLIKPGTQSWWVDLLEKILGWGFFGLMLLLLLVVLAIAAFYAVKWLFSKTSGNRARGSKAVSASWWTRLRGLFVSSRQMIKRAVTGYKRAAELYRALLYWARRSGLPRVQSETPLEFGARLNSRFPALKPQIELIIGSFNREVYGEVVLSGVQLAALRSAWRILRSPLHWPMRVRGWFSTPTVNLNSKLQYRNPKQFINN
ncbi:MAG TPA: DUF4129 domain-containing protein, partial [Syntrophorhabdales bacterium]|nr:DUF4129 domain-containing protein [Syntrophorhabdales bacterium]